MEMNFTFPSISFFFKKLPFLDWFRLTGVGGADSVCIVSSTER